MENAALQVSTKFRAIDQLTAVVKKMQTATSAFTKKTAAGLAYVHRIERKVRAGFDRFLGTLGKLGLGLSALLLINTVVDANLRLDESLQSLQAITGVTGQKFKSFEKEIDRIAKSQRRFKADIANTFDIVGSAQPQLLESSKALGTVSEAVIVLGRAASMAPEEAAAALTQAMNQFGALPEEAMKYADILAASQQKGTAKIYQLNEAMVNAGSAARAAGLDFEETNVALQALAAGGIIEAKAGEALTGVLSMLAASTDKKINPSFTKFSEVIDNLSKRNLTLDDANKLVGRHMGKYLLTLIAQNEVIKRLTKSNDDLHSGLWVVGAAQEQADIKANSLKNRLLELKYAFLNQVTTTDQSNKSMQKLKDTLLKIADNMDKIIPFVWNLIKAFIAYKLILGAVTVAQTILNIVTAAFKNPYLLLALAVIALIVWIGVLIKKYHEWGAAILLLMGPIGWMINLIQSIRRNWNMIIDAFKSKGILAGIWAIGKTIFDAILLPVQVLLKLLSKIPGVGKFIEPAADKLQAFRETLHLNTETDERGRPLNVEAELERGRTEREERLERNYVQIGVQAMENTRARILKNTGIDVELSQTLGWQE
jgi:TP901 family phage tail tape measure protein